jgi:hypothetical protein
MENDTLNLERTAEFFHIHRVTPLRKVREGEAHSNGHISEKEKSSAAGTL